MRIEVLTIGDEVLSGTITDTNFAWIGQQLWGRGLDLHRHMTVGDEPGSIAEALLEAGARSDLVVVTGGLGPTIDDITLESAANAFGCGLVLDEPSLDAIQERFRRFGRVMNPTNRKQAMLPDRGSALPNPVGTAPGCRITNGRATFFFLPGVPAEMKAMFAAEVLPWLDSCLTRKPAFAYRILRCFGMPEANIQEKVQMVDLTGLDLAFRPTPPEVLLKVSARGREGDAVEARVHDAASTLAGLLGEAVYGIGDKTMPALVLDELALRGSTLAIVDIGTGGALAQALISEDPGMVVDSKSMMRAPVIVEARVLPCVDSTEPKAGILATQARTTSNATYALVLEALAEPGVFQVSLAGPGHCETMQIRPGRNRVWSRPFAAWSAIAWLRSVLRGAAG
jgi:nicotinamide-nucleotide amidase